MDQIIAFLNDFLNSAFGKNSLQFFTGSFNLMFPADAPAAEK
ncbi:hypothetical protein [Corynebacterium ulceribovis]|nr:hypothetical protein [Corynebacterium ulceribovis]